MSKRINAWYGCRRDTQDFRDYRMPLTAMRLPAAVDLRGDCPTVMDQGDLGSCTAHGITGALRYEMIRGGHGDVQLSRLQLYYDERTIEGTLASDAGAEIRDGIKSAAKKGVGHESLWRYTIRRFREKPPAAVYKDAINFKALEYARVEVSVTALKSAIAQGHTPVIGLTLYESFESAAVEKTGMVPMPGRSESVAGGHCMYVVGYGQRKGTFTVRNSWGSDWGLAGDCFFPETYLGSAKLGADYWVIRAQGRA